PILVVAQGPGASGVRADVIALDQVSDRVATVHPDAATYQITGDGVVGDDVAGRGRRPANRVYGGVVDQDSVLAVAQSLQAGDIGADQVALHQIAHGTAPGAIDQYTIAEVAGDEVAGPCGRPTNRGVGGSGGIARLGRPQVLEGDGDSGIPVAQS